MVAELVDEGALWRGCRQYGFTVWGLGFRTSGWGLGVQGLRVKAQAFGSGRGLIVEGEMQTDTRQTPPKKNKKA